MRFGSVCSGIEAASVAWYPLGWEAAWLSEIEPFPCAVLAHHYPNVPNHGDMSLLPNKIRAGEVEAPDLLCGGTPCQAFSVAGLRQSLDDARGNLTLTFCEIADAIDSKREQPCIVFWENVPGVLNTKDNAFGCFLGALAGEDDALVAPGGRWANAGFIDGPQRAVAWRVLDAQYFGVAQRRRRVFVVASARADFDPAAVLFEFEGVRRDTAPSREAWQVAPTIPSRSTAGDSLGTDFDCDGGVIASADPAYCLETTCNDYSRADGFNMLVQPVLAPIALAENTIGRQPHNGGTGDGFTEGGPMYTLNATGVHGVAQPIAFHPTQDPISSTDGTSHAMGCGSSSGQASVAIAFQPTADCLTAAYGTKWNGNASATNGSLFAAQPLNIYGGNKRPDRPEGGFYVRMDEDTTKTLDAASGLNPTCAQGGTAGMQPIGIFQDSEFGVAQYDSAGTLRAGRIPEHQMAIQPPSMAVRRLTPVECERLQGFPDNYTNIPWRKKPAGECPDGPRYKALGNSWAVPVVRWIGRRIQESMLREYQQRTIDKLQKERLSGVQASLL
jgi:DNA (cytosine-5)-methyltransferase 1